MSPRPAPKPTLGRPATGLSRYFMDCGWYRHPKFAGLPVEALFLFEAGIGYCTEHATNGVMSGDLEQLSLDLGVKLSVVRKGVSALINAGRWREVGAEIRIAGFEDHNPLAEEVAEFSEVQRARSSYGNHVRHHVNKQVSKDDCPHCRDSLGSFASEPPGKEIASEPSLSDSHGMGWDGNPPPTSSVPSDDAHPNGAGERARPAEEETLAATWIRMAEVAARNATITTSPAGWKRAHAGRMAELHGQRARAEITANPALTPTELAEILDPACGPDDGGAARAAAATDATRQMIDQRDQAAADLADWEAEADRRLDALDDAERSAIRLAAPDPGCVPAAVAKRVIRGHMRAAVMDHPAPDLEHAR